VDLRQAWETEAGDFTPWLAQPQNLKLLYEAIGLDELELEGQEQNVGPFRADIVCRNPSDNSLVIIENQLERTDHNHLGQLITYAAGLKAVTIVWIADRFTDEHRAALDWLNDITNESFNFFALEIELWRIDNSLAAPKFNVVSKPNQWTKSDKPPGGELTEVKRLQVDYWTEFKDYVEKHSKIINPTKPLPQHWMNIAIGRSNFKLVALVDSWDKKISAGLIIWGPDAKPFFYLLEEEKKRIEEEFGGELLWRELPNNKESQILLRMPDNDPVDREQWPKQHKQLCETLEAFHRVFAHRIRKLNAADYQPISDNAE